MNDFQTGVEGPHRGPRVVVLSAFVVACFLVSFAAIGGTASYDELRNRSAGVALPPRDHEDRSPLTDEERRVVRYLIPGLLTAGPYQYPRYAPMLIEALRVGDGSPGVSGGVSRRTSPGTNVNVSNRASAQNETNIRIDPGSPNYLVAASNDRPYTRQALYSSSDSGATWTYHVMPGDGVHANQGDPGVAFDSAGGMYAVTLGFTPGAAVLVSRSTDHGATWGAPVSADGNGADDKELIAGDTSVSSPCRDNLYVAWDQSGSGAYVSRSSDRGATWAPAILLSGGGQIGACPAVGPAGEVYVALDHYDTQTIEVYKSTDCGATFGLPVVAANVGVIFGMVIPAMCTRGVVIVPALDVDRSSGPRRGWLYLAYVDGVDGGMVCPASLSDVRFCRSTDGGTTWSTPILVHEDLPGTDQFNQWLAVDPADGAIHVAYVDTRDDPARLKTNVYYNRSTDGGFRFEPSVRVTTAQTDETCCGADAGIQYGDYDGLASHGGSTYPMWTDRRSGLDEEIYTARVVGGALEEIVTGPGPGPANAPTVRIWSHATPPVMVAEWAAYAATGYGANVAPGGIDSAVTDRVVTGPGPGAIYGPQVRAFTSTGTPIGKVNFYAYGTLRYGVNVGAGELDVDGFQEISTGAGPGAVFGPHVRAFDYDGVVVTPISGLSFFAYGTLKFGVNQASGAIDGTPRDELATAPGPGSVFSPNVRGFAWNGVSVMAIAKVNFNAFAVTRMGGRIDVADVDDDGFSELAAAKGPDPAFDAEVRAYDYDGGTVAQLFAVTPFPGLFYGARIGGGDVDGDGRAELLVGPGPSSSAAARVVGYGWNGTSTSVDVPEFAAYALFFGANAGGGEMGSI